MGEGQLSSDDVAALLDVVRDARAGGFRERMERVGAAISRAVGAQCNTVWALDLARPQEAQALFRGRDESVLREYLASARAHDPMNRGIEAADGRIDLLSDFVPDRAWGGDPFTGEFLKGCDVRYIMGATCPMPDGLRVGLGLQREGSRRGDFGPRERALFELVLPDFARAAFGALLREKVERLAAAAGPASDGAGAIVFDRLGDVVHADPGGLAALHEAGGAAVERLADDAHRLAQAGEGATHARAFTLGDGRVLETRASTFRLHGPGVLVTTRLGPPPRRPPPGADRLSARELEVAALAADGLSNRDIAERLRISPATVGVHLSRVFRKLDVSGRSALVRWFHGPR